MLIYLVFIAIDFTAGSKLTHELWPQTPEGFMDAASTLGMDYIPNSNISDEQQKQMRWVSSVCVTMENGLSCLDVELLSCYE